MSKCSNLFIKEIIEQWTFLSPLDEQSYGWNCNCGSSSFTKSKVCVCGERFGLMDFSVLLFILSSQKEKNGCSFCDSHLCGSVQPRLCVSGASRKHNIYKIANLFKLKKMLHMHTHIIGNHQYRQIIFSIKLAHNCRLWSSRHHGRSLHCLR